MQIQNLTEAAGKNLLAEAGIQTPTFTVVETSDAAVEAATTVGYPVVVKVLSPEISHKSEWGNGVGVTVNCQTAESVRSAANEIFAAAADRNTEVSILIEQSYPVEDGIETILSGFRDQTFGPVVGFGIGGTAVELLDDMAYRLAPVDKDSAYTLLEEPKLSLLLEGYRGGPRVDKDVLASTIQRVGQLLADNEEIHELEINPLLATVDSSIALDALITRKVTGDTTE